MNRLFPCAVCFAQTGNADIVKAYSWGIAAMLVPTFLIIGALIYAFYKIENARKSSHV